MRLIDSISHHITPLDINSLGGRDTHTHVTDNIYFYKSGACWPWANTHLVYEFVNNREMSIKLAYE